MPAETFGRRLREARERKGWSLAELSDRTGGPFTHTRVTAADIERAENGLYESVSMRDFFSLADALAEEAYSLLGRKGSEVAK